MRKEPLVTGEYYHIYNRGVDKRDIFNDLNDLARFKESIKQFNQVEGIGSLEMYNKSVRALDSHPLKSQPVVAIVAFCVNPNHFHFVLKQLVDGGIAKFMQKLQAGYTSYFNIKNSRTGSLFQGTFKSHLVSNENYFNKIIGYKNKNFKVVSKIEGLRILEVFGGSKNFKKHCDEIVSIIREERGKPSLLEEE